MSRSSIIGAVMEAIRDLVPLDDGSHWSVTAHPRWPQDYSSSERQRIRSIATAAVLAIEAALSDCTAPGDGGHKPSTKAGSGTKQ